MKEPKIDIKGLVELLGGATVLQRKLALFGYSDAPSVEAIRKWMQRGSFSSDWLAALLALARAEGRPVDIYQYLEVEG